MQRYTPLLVFALTAAAGFAVIKGAAALVLVGFIGMMLMAVVARDPVTLWAVTLVSNCVMNAIPGSPIPMTIFKPLFILSTLIFVALVLRRGRVTMAPRLWLAGMASLLLIRLVADVISPAVGNMWRIFTMIAPIMLVAYASQFITNMRHHRTIAFVLMCMAVISGLWAAVETPPWALGQGVRALGPGGQPNTTAANAARLFLFALPLLWDRGAPALYRFMAFAGIPAFAYAQFSTASRGAVIAFVAGLVAFSITVPRSIGVKLLAPFLVGITVSVVALAAPESFNQRFEETVRVSDTGDVIEVEDSSRRVLAELALIMMRESPIIGHGEKGYNNRAEQVFNGIAYSVHTSYLGVAVAFGVPFMVLYVLLLWGALLMLWRMASAASGMRRYYYAGMLGAVAFEAVFAFSASEFFTPLGWTTIGLAHLYDERKPAAAEDENKPVRPRVIAQPPRGFQRPPIRVQ